MNTAEQILVILLAVALAVLLVLAIVAVVAIIRLVQSLRRISESAERVVHTAEAAAEMLKKTATPLSIFSFVKHIVNQVTDRPKKGK